MIKQVVAVRQRTVVGSRNYLIIFYNWRRKSLQDKNGRNNESDFFKD